MPFDREEKNRQVYEFLTRHQSRAQNDGFAEVYIEDSLPEGSADVQKSSFKITPPDPLDEIVRERFYVMRQISHKGDFTTASYEKRQAALFCAQGRFMADFEDNYSEKVRFERYFPDYQGMGHGQLRTYFTWRTKVRAGVCEQTDLAYVFLYVYELINNIGVKPGEEGMERLLDIWQSYEKIEPKFSNYMELWVKDYYIVNDLPYSYSELRKKRGDLTQRLSREDLSLIEFYGGYSPYKINKSAFFTGENKELTNGYFTFIVKELERISGLDFDDFIFFKAKGGRWTPFSRALYYSGLGKGEGKSVLSKTESYYYLNGTWYASSSRVVKESGRQLLGIIIRSTEDFCRRTTGYRHKLSLKTTFPDKEVLTKLSMTGQAFEKFIAAALNEHYSDLNRISVTVNPKRLEVIREKAFETQEKLIIEEQPYEAPVSAEPIYESSVTDDPKTEETPKKFQHEDSWLTLELTEDEKQLLRLILKGEDMRALIDHAKASGQMLEVITESINEKAMEAVGDYIIELGEEAEIFEDYLEDIERVTEA